MKVFNRTQKVQLNEHHADRSQLSDVQSTITSELPSIHKTVKPGSLSTTKPAINDPTQAPVHYRRQSSLRHSNYFGHGDVYGKSSLNNTYSKKYISCENIKNIGLDLNDASRNKTKYNNFNDIVDIDELNNEDDDEAGIKEILVKRYNSLTSLLMKSFRKAKKKKKEAAANTSTSISSSQQLNSSIYQTQDNYQNQKEVSMYRKHHTNYNQMKIGAKSNDLVRRGSIISNLSLVQSHHVNNDVKNSNENTNSMISLPANNTHKNVSSNDQGDKNNDSIPVFLSAKVISNEFVDLNKTNHKTNHKTNPISNSDTLPSTSNDNSKGADNIDKIISQKYHNLNQILAGNNNAKNLSANRNSLNNSNNNNNTENMNTNTNGNTIQNKQNNSDLNNTNKNNQNEVKSINNNVENSNKEVTSNDRISVTLNKNNSLKESQGDKNQYPTLNKLILKGINDSNIIKKPQENIKHEFSSHLKPHAPKIPIKTCISVSETIDESESDDVTIKAPTEYEAPVILRNPPPVPTKTPQVLPNDTTSGATVRRAKTFTQQLHEILNERKEKTSITVSHTFHEPQKHATLPKERPVQNLSEQNRISQQLNLNINQTQHAKPILLQESIVNPKQLSQQLTHSQCHYEQHAESFEIKSEYAKIKSNLELELAQSQANKTPRTMSITSSVTNPDFANLPNQVLNQLRLLTSEKEKNNDHSELLAKTNHFDFLDSEIDDLGLDTQIYDYNDIRLKHLKTIKENDNDDFMDLVQVLAKQDDLFKKKFFDCLMTKLWDTSIPYNEYYQLNKLMIALFGESYHKFGNVSNRKPIDKLDAEDVVSLVRAYLDKNKSNDDTKLEMNHFIENQIRPTSNLEPQSYSSVSNLINTLKRRKKIELNKQSLEDLVDKNKYSFMNGYEASSIESSKVSVNEKTFENDQSAMNTITKVDPCFREMARELLMEIKQESHELAKKAEESVKKETKSQIIHQLTEPQNFVRNKLRSTISNYQNIKLDYADIENDNLNMLNNIILKNNQSIIHSLDFSNNQHQPNEMTNAAKIADLVRLNQYASNLDNLSCVDVNIKKLGSDIVNSIKRHNTITARTNFQAEQQQELVASQIPIANERNKLKRNSLWIETKQDHGEASVKPNNNISIIEKRDKTPINLNRFLTSAQPPKPKIVSKNSTMPMTMAPLSLAPEITSNHQHLVNKTIQIRNLKEIFNSESSTVTNQMLMKSNNSDEQNKNIPNKNFNNDTIKKVLIIPKVNANNNQVIMANSNVLKSKPVLLENQKYVSYNGESTNNRKPQANIQKLEGSFPLEFNARNSIYNVINNVGENLINRNSKIPLNSSCYSNKISAPFETISRNKNISDYKNFINVGNYHIVDGNLKQSGYQMNKLTASKANDMTFFKTIYELNTPNLNNSNRQHMSNRLNCKEMQQAFY